MSRFRYSLRYKIGAFMLALSLGPLVTAGLVVLAVILGELGDFYLRLGAVENSLRSDVVGRTLRGAAVDTAAEIDNYLLARIVDVRGWSEDHAIVEAARGGTLAAQAGRLSGLSSQAARIPQGGQFVPIDPTLFSPALAFVFRQTERPATPLVEIMVTEASGINVLITRPVARVAHADEPWWQAAAAANLTGIGVIDAHIDSDGKTPVFGLALPIVDPDTKQVLGVIRALFRLSDLHSRLSQKAASVSADMRIFTHDGQLIADTASDHSPQLVLSQAGNMLEQNYTPAIKALDARPGLEGAGFVTEDGANGRDVVGYAHTNGSIFYDRRAQVSGFEGLDWGVTVSQPESLALQVLLELIKAGQEFERLPVLFGLLFAAATVGAAVVALLGAILISGNITRPLVDLSRMAKRVEEGDLSVGVEARTQDEVGILARAFNTMTAGLRERERIRDVLGRAVSPQVREKWLCGELELGGETRRVTVLFSDIRSFSTLSETMSPQQVVAFLNEYLTEMSEAIRPWGGYLNNFIGDAIVTVFGAPADQPDKEWLAVRAALEMRRRLVELNRRRTRRGDLPIDSGIGISTGEAVAGQIGSLERLMYTVIGDTVNVAARLEALTKEYAQHPILINSPTADALKQRGDIELECLGPISVKGRAEPVDVYAVVCTSYD